MSGENTERDQQYQQWQLQTHLAEHDISLTEHIEHRVLEVEVSCDRCRFIPGTDQITHEKIEHRPKSTIKPDLLILIVLISSYHKLTAPACAVCH